MPEQEGTDCWGLKDSPLVSIDTLQLLAWIAGAAKKSEFRNPEAHANS
jgi:hypothetical protein